MYYRVAAGGPEQAGVETVGGRIDRDILEALVSSYNAGGGLAGRHIEPFYYEAKASSVSYSGDQQAACTQFAQDNHVAVATVGGFQTELATCLAKARIPQMVAWERMGDDRDLAAMPYLVGPNALSANEQETAVLRHFAATRLLSKSSKIGVVVGTCPAPQRVYTDTVAPLARQLGLTISQRFDTRCFDGFNAFGEVAAEMQNAVLRFRSAGIDRVLFVHDAEQLPFLHFSQQAQSQQYFPKYALSSEVAADIASDNVPEGQLANARGVGWVPARDVANSRDFQTEAGRLCLQRIRAGVQPAANEDYFIAYSYCDVFALYAKLLQLANGSSSPSAIAAARAQLHTAFVGSATINGSTDFTNRRVGVNLGREFEWSSSCKCFRYVGSTFQVP